jgi:UDP-N-acetylglucosamine 2-epimerase (non-hydrolysing)
MNTPAAWSGRTNGKPLSSNRAASDGETPQSPFDEFVNGGRRETAFEPARGLTVLSVFGTRPEAIKMAPVVQTLSDNAFVKSRVCVTAQHRGMLDQVLAHFAIRPDHDLDVMIDGQTSSGVASRVISRLEPILEMERPDWVLVQGDTTTTLAAALAASYGGVKIAHIEAGLRSFDRKQPFPEENNRRLVTTLADLHFAPTADAKANLLMERVPTERIFVTGNTGIDALYWTVGRLMREKDPLENPWGYVPAGNKVILATAHRRENLGPAFEEICRALYIIATRFIGKVHIVVPLHPREEVRATAHALLGGFPNVRLIEPLDYLSMVRLLLRSDFVITDSGGLQEEGPALGKPVLVLRNVTERPEGIEGGSARLVGTRTERIVAEATELIRDQETYARMARRAEHYGDGRAAGRIVDALVGQALDLAGTPRSRDSAAPVHLHPQNQMVST